MTAFAHRSIVPVTVERRQLILVRDQQRVFCAGRACPHEGADLAKGRCSDGRLFCPRHYAWFELENGRVSPGWAFSDLHVHPVKIVGDEIFVGVEPF